MKRLKHRVKWYLSWFVVDTIIISFSYIISFYIRSSIGSYQSLTDMPLFNVFTVGITISYMYMFGGYHRIWARTSGEEVTLIIAAVFASLVTVLGVEIAILGQRPLPISVVVFANFLALIGFVMARYRSRAIRGLQWRWRLIWKHEIPLPTTRVLIIGAGESGENVARRLKNRTYDGRRYTVVGFIDDDEAKQNRYVLGCKVLGQRQNIPDIVVSQYVHLIVFAIHNITGQEFRDILSYCEKTNARIKVAPDVIAFMNDLNGSPLLRDLTAEDYLGRKQIGKNKDIDFSPIMGKRVLVTGAAGSIGSELCRQLVQDYKPEMLLMVDINESGIYDLMADLKSQFQEDVEIIDVLCDITHRQEVENVVAKYRPEVIFHAAAYKHVPMLERYPQQSIRVNIEGTLNVAECAVQYDVERFVLISTDKAVDPTSVMGASKRICELLVLSIAMQTNTTIFTAVRFGNVLGSRGSVVPIFQRQLEVGGPLTVTHPDMKRYFMSIKEAANLILHASCLTRNQDLFILKMGEEISILELARRMIRQRGLRPDVDIKIEFTGIRDGEKLQEVLQNGFEKSEATVHPDIIKLYTVSENFDAELFRRRVCELISNGLNAKKSPLEHLNYVIELAQEQITTA